MDIPIDIINLAKQPLLIDGNYPTRQRHFERVIRARMIVNEHFGQQEWPEHDWE